MFKAHKSILIIGIMGFNILIFIYNKIYINIFNLENDLI